GFTLVELLVAVVVTAVLLAAVTQTVIVQQRTYREQMAVLGARQTARTALELIGTELREVSASGNDIYVATPDSIRFRAYKKIGVVCAVVTGSVVDVWELGTPFAQRDSAVVFSDGGAPDETGDTWVPVRVSDRTPTDQCTETWGAYPLTGLRLYTTLPSVGVAPGALVRQFVPVTYGIFRINGEWVVGRKEGDAPLVALLGPIAPENGLEFRYYNGSGQPFQPVDAAQRRDIERIEIVVRVPLEGAGGGAAAVDSLVTQVQLRGNSWY
ncbi:MAG TPA: prepilin-type N-terminal cleavage/methylation domain-containing protein, partial [Longimicrobiales bacterium]